MPYALRLVPVTFLVLLASVASAHGFALTEYQTGFGSNPDAIAIASGGGAWFGEAGGIARIDAKGRIQRYPVPGTPPQRDIITDLVPAAHGGAWFTQEESGAVRHISPTGSITDVPTGAGPADDVPQFLAPGPAGDTWYITGSGARAGHVTSAGQMTQFQLPATVAGHWHPIAVGPDHRLWIASGGTVYALDARGRVSTYPLPTGDEALSIAAGPDGRVWIAKYAGRIVRVTPSGMLRPLVLDRKVIVPNDAVSMVSGPGGRMWITSRSANEIVDIGSSGHVTEHGPRAPGQVAVPFAGYGTTHQLAPTTGSRLWVSEPSQGRVALVTTGPSCGVPAVVGKTERAAAGAMRAAGCRARFAGSASATATVTAQSVKARTIVSPRTTVKLTLGRASTACRLPDDAYVVARSAEAVVAQRVLTDGDTWIGCAASTGRIVTVFRARDLDFPYESLDVQVVVSGTHAALSAEGSNHYNDGLTLIQTQDLAAGTPPVTVATRDFATDRVGDVAVAPGGEVAWIDTTLSSSIDTPLSSTIQMVYRWVAGTVTSLDSGSYPALTSLTADAVAFRWTNAGVAKSAPVAG
jgi:virginiamycin B lyase